MTVLHKNKRSWFRCSKAFGLRVRHVVSLMVLPGVFAVFGAPQAAADDIAAGIDVWSTPAGSTTEDLPAGLCFPQAVPAFEVEGAPFPGEAFDTIVERLDDAVFPPGCPASATVDIQIRALSLVSVNPVNVGGQLFDVRVCLSDANPQPPGQMVIDHNCPGGGTFDSFLPVVPKFIFTPVGGGPPVNCDPPGAVLQQNLVGGGSWAHDSAFAVTQVQGLLGVSGPCAEDFAPPGLSTTTNFNAGIGFAQCDCDSQSKLQCETLTPEGIHKVLTSEPPGTFVGCCLPDGTCKDLDKIDCILQSAPNPPLFVPEGVCVAREACCFPDGTCEMVDPSCCLCRGGTPVGVGTFCKGDLNGNGIDDVCEAAIPTVSTWGLVVLTLLLLVGAKIYFGRRRSAAASA